MISLLTGVISENMLQKSQARKEELNARPAPATLATSWTELKAGEAALNAGKSCTFWACAE